ncbi:hypothetical protein SAMN04487761_10416 [Lachnospiraceae bacterium C7]|nr:hypothetical protein SAMN04487761_10416 [Lachnospiraceae bacterium C7]
MQIEKLTAYKIIETKKLDDIGSTGYILEHIKSGARVSIISNSDDNKVFYIGFKTPPKDETGVPHIIEHTVLCGSDKFPVKDPFVELVKGSLNTFLNAMTYPDKTVYPIASCNDKDFQNLMDVYLDAVFHPNIYKHKEIFKQEGWHYELENKDAPLTINGVVYNEMKGAYSSPEEILQEQISRALFPDNAYGKDSGGNPQHIPELTYEDYLNFHRKYYHPANSYIYLYGDMDVAKKLDWMDKEYLSNYDRIDVDSEIKKQPAFKEVKTVEKEYSIASEEDPADKTYLSYSKVIADVLDKKLYQAFDVLEYALVSAPGAPVRKALLDAGIGKDILSSYDAGILQPTFTITAKRTNKQEQARFVEVIEKELKRLVKEGLNKDALRAAINASEFRFREADFGQFPKGLLYGLQLLDSWLFDDTKPFIHIECLDTFKFLKEQIDTNYFEELIQKYLLDNTHGAVVSLVPVAGLNSKADKALEDELAKVKASMSEKEIEQLVEDTKSLKQYQEEPSPKEDLEKIPMLKREDMRKDVLPFSNIEKEVEGVKVVLHDYETNGIDYINYMFDISDFSKEELFYVGILKATLSFVDTKNYKYADLSNAINIYTGGISFTTNNFSAYDGSDELYVKAEVKMKVLHENLSKAIELVREVMFNTDFSDKTRLKEIISQSVTRLRSSLSNNGNLIAAMRAMTYFSKFAYYVDNMSGLEFYRQLCDIDKNFQEKADEIIEKLYAVLRKIVCKNRLIVSVTSNNELYEETKDVLAKEFATYELGETVSKMPAIEFTQKNEGFMDASQIQYVARAGSFKKHGFEYSGYLRILKVILSYDYLWINVRVKGGAYGCSGSFLRTGEGYLVSYRDPNLSKTNDIYEKTPEYLRNFNPNERDMTKYIIGTFSSMDTPLYPEGMGSRSMSAYISKLSIDTLQKERDQIRNATVEDIRNLADLVQAILDDGNICVIGNEDNIKKESKLFKNIETL